MKRTTRHTTPGGEDFSITWGDIGLGNEYVSFRGKVDGYILEAVIQVSAIGVAWSIMRREFARKSAILLTDGVAHDIDEAVSCHIAEYLGVQIDESIAYARESRRLKCEHDRRIAPFRQAAENWLEG